MFFSFDWFLPSYFPFHLLLLFFKIIVVSCRNEVLIMEKGAVYWGFIYFVLSFKLLGADRTIHSNKIIFIF